MEATEFITISKQLQENPLPTDKNNENKLNHNKWNRVLKQYGFRPSRLEPTTSILYPECLSLGRHTTHNSCKNMSQQQLLVALPTRSEMCCQLSIRARQHQLNKTHVNVTKKKNNNGATRATNTLLMQNQCLEKSDNPQQRRPNENKINNCCNWRTQRTEQAQPQQDFGKTNVCEYGAHIRTYTAIVGHDLLWSSLHEVVAHNRSQLGNNQPRARKSQMYVLANKVGQRNKQTKPCTRKHEPTKWWRRQIGTLHALAHKLYSTHCPSTL